MDRDSGHFPQWNISGGVHSKRALLQKLGPRGAESSSEPGTLWLYLGAHQPMEWCRMWSTWTHCLQTIELNTINLATLRHIFVFLFHQHKQDDYFGVLHISQYCVKGYFFFPSTFVFSSLPFESSNVSEFVNGIILDWIKTMSWKTVPNIWKVSKVVNKNNL